MSELSQKSLASVGFGGVVFLVGVIFLLPAADGYEFSIYAAYPWYFWVVLAVSIVIGQVLILRTAVSNRASDLYWGLGVFLTLLGNAIVLFMPYIRGYPAYERADVLSHLGHIRNIRDAGVLGGQNIYPNVHQLVVTLSYATGIEPIHVINTVPPILSLFSVVASAALVTTLYDRRKALFALPFVCVLIGGTSHANASPFAQSVLLLPFVFYLLVKEQQRPTLAVRIALAISLVALVIYHPLTTVFVLIFLAIYTVARWEPVATRLAGWHAMSSHERSHLLTGVGSVNRLVVGTFAVWYYNFTGIFVRFASLRDRLLNRGEGSTTLESYSSTVSRTSPALVDLVEIAVTSYGLSILLLSFGGLNFLKQLRSRAFDSFSTKVFEFSFSASVMAFGGLSVVFLLFDLIAEFGRPLIFARYFAVFVVGSLFYDLYRLSRENRNVPRAMVVLLTVMVALSVITVHHSPLTIRENQQVTEAELDGAEWYLTQANESVPVQELGITLHRFEDALTGFSPYGPLEESRPPPDHFGYDTRARFGAGFDESQYMVITTSGRYYYPNIWPDYPQYWRLTQDDFDGLDSDPTVARVYANGELDLYMVAGTNTTSPAA